MHAKLSQDRFKANRGCAEPSNYAQFCVRHELVKNIGADQVEVFLDKNICNDPVRAGDARLGDGATARCYRRARRWPNHAPGRADSGLARFSNTRRGSVSRPGDDGTGHAGMSRRQQSQLHDYGHIRNDLQVEHPSDRRHVEACGARGRIGECRGKCEWFFD